MITENQFIEVIDQDQFIKKQVPIHELIELIYQRINEEMTRKVKEPKEKTK